jgi:DNA-binding winged helix-turn-helix (wHTH) protein
LAKREPVLQSKPNYQLQPGKVVPESFRLPSISGSSNVRLRFGDCFLDTGVRELRRAGQIVPLSPKAFRLLEVLTTRRPNAVSQDELRTLLWPDTMMGGTTLARLVSDMRSAIGDEGGSKELVRTVHRFGYAFCGRAVEEPAPATTSLRTSGCAIQWGAQIVPLAPGENVIGRSPDALISVASPKVSRRHARILVSDERATIEDLGSRNGTYVGELKIDACVELKHGDRIGIGPAMLIFCAPGDEAATVTSNN